MQDTLTEEQKLELVTIVATDLIDEHLNSIHGFSKWAFRWNERKRAIGICAYYERTIYLSRPYVLQATMEEITDTIMHEIAHALVGWVHQHGPVWKAKARELGAHPRACSKHAVVYNDYKYALECETCGRVWGRYRLRASSYTHDECKNGPHDGNVIIRPWTNE